MLDPPDGEPGGLYTRPRAFPVWADTLGSQFLSHPPIEPYTVRRSPGADGDPLVAGIGSFEADDELYLMEHHGDVVPLLETRWTGTTRGFADAEWPDDEPRLVLYRRRLGDGEVVYFTLGHCRSHWDMVHPPFNGARWPTIDRGSWDVAEYVEILERALAWATGRRPQTASGRGMGSGPAGRGRRHPGQRVGDEPSVGVEGERGGRVAWLDVHDRAALGDRRPGDEVARRRMVAAVRARRPRRRPRARTSR